MFVKLSRDKAQAQKIVLDNVFITDYMPFAPDISVKAYLYGLSLAVSGNDNSIDMIASKLNVSADEVLSAFKYWENQGLVSILSISPPAVEYKEPKPAAEQLRYFSKAKYKAFNDQLHAMVSGRTIMQNEYAEYYNAMETLHIEKEAMLAIIAYCVRYKGENIGYPYILTVARDLAAKGLTTFDRVNDQLNELDLYTEEIKAVLKALTLKRAVDMADRRLYNKWTKTLGFTPETIVRVAKEQKKGGMEKLDAALMRYHSAHVFSYDDIQKYNLDREQLFALTGRIVKILSLYYERLDYIIESYTQKWLNFGFNDEALTAIADYCFKRNKRSLEDMDEAVNAFYRQGLLTREGIEGFRAEAAGKDETVKKILAAARIERGVNSWDRDFYRTWTYSWNMPHEVIEHAARLGAGKGLAYINGILANWNAKNIHDLQSAQNAGIFTSGMGARPPLPAAAVTSKSFEELDKLFGEVSVEDM